MTLVHIMTTLLMAIPLIDIAAICGSQAEQLRLPTASLAKFAPLFMLAGYWGCLFLLRRTRISRYRAPIAVAVGAFFAAYPAVLLSALSISLPLSRDLRSSEIQQMHAVFPHPFVHYSASGEGHRLRIRSVDRSDALIAFLASINADGVK